MKILYLCPDLGIPVLGRKGAAVHVRELIGALHRAGHRVTLAVQSLTKTAGEARARVHARVIQIPSSASATKAAQDLKDFNEQLGTENPLRRLCHRRIGLERAFDGLLEGDRFERLGSGLRSERDRHETEDERQDVTRRFLTHERHLLRLSHARAVVWPCLERAF